MPNPCKNNGYCDQSGEMFHCECGIGFRGFACEQIGTHGQYMHNIYGVCGNMNVSNICEYELSHSNL